MLRGVPVTRPNHVWSTDVTYIQFTSKAFTDVLIREGVSISMDGRGRALDNIFVERLWRNVKHEDVYLKGYASMGELTVGLAQYFAFYNGERPHQSLGYKTPAEVYRSGTGGGALIVDRYGDTGEVPAEEPCRGQPLEDEALQQPQGKTGRCDGADATEQRATAWMHNSSRPRAGSSSCLRIFNIAGRKLY
jgi:hypothetical protein